jgi:hypothetical protein
LARRPGRRSRNDDARHIPERPGTGGRLTGFAALGAVGTGALFEALDKNTLQPSAIDAAQDAQRALNLYSTATHLDRYAGTWPATDTGRAELPAG